MAIALPDARQLSDEALETLRMRALRGVELGFTEAGLHGNRILFRDKAEQDAFQDVGREAGAVAFAAQTLF